MINIAVTFVLHLIYVVYKLRLSYHFLLRHNSSKNARDKHILLKPQTLVIKYALA